MRHRYCELIAVFLVAFASLLFEITATKIFEFSVWANYAYLVISTAMFGFGLSGVILTCWPKLLQIKETTFLFSCALLSGITFFTAFHVMNTVPIHLPSFPDGVLRELLNITAVFVSMGVPFAFIGLIIGFLFEKRGSKANIYYFADLVGAGLGCFALVPLIQLIQPQGLVVLASGTAIVGAFTFLIGSEGPSRKLNAVGTVAAVAAAVLTALWTPRAADHIALKVHVSKRSFKDDLEKGNIEATKWSALSRVDIADMSGSRKRVWIAGGVNESAIVNFDGDFESLAAKREALLERAAKFLHHKAIPHTIKTNHTVCVIGTSGGEDSLYGLMMGARHVLGIEMDPAIAEFVTVDYRDYAGGLFTDGKYSELVVDEGRSYLRRSNREFDLIHQVNNFTPIAFQNGSLNLSETYLLTVESFRDFYDHLTDDGILAISRWGTIRMLSVAVEMFRQMGMSPEEYSKRLFVGEGSQWHVNTFMMKKSPFTEGEIDTLYNFYESGDHERKILYAPHRTEDLPDIDNNLYYQIATSQDPSKFWRLGCFNFEPSTDKRPFFNHFKILGLQDRNRDEMPMLPGEIYHVEAPNKLDKRVPKGDLPPLIILLEGLLLSTVFFGIPMFSKRELRETLRQNRRPLGYFAFLGIAFIFVEICLIQKLVLFLGAPVYSMASVLASLLVFAGLGSLCSGIMKPSVKNLRILLLIVALVVLAVHFGTPAITGRFLGSSLPVRMLVAILFTGIAGFFMGMPMPSGIRHLKATGKQIIPWGWAVNGYFTVIGTALSVLIAVNFGFTTVFAIAAILYVSAPLFLGKEPS